MYLSYVSVNITSDLRKIEEEVTKDNNLGILRPNTINTTYNFDKIFKIILPTREEWQDIRIAFGNNEIIIYTDGSKTNDGEGREVFG